MKKFFTLLASTCLLLSMTMDTVYRDTRNDSFGLGERLEYRVHYGMLSAAEASMTISNKIHTVNNRPCYKVDIHGKSVGLFAMVMHLQDNWGTYIDTASIIPQRFYQNIEEGKYRLKEVVEFDHSKDIAITNKYHKKTKEYTGSLTHKVPNNVQDLVSGYYYLRTIDYSQHKIGDVISLKGFFDKEVYDFKVRLIGREILKTKIGKINSLILAPIMPKNDLFEGEDSIRVWLSDDKNKIPLKVRAKLFLGAVEIDIKSQEGSRNSIGTVR